MFRLGADAAASSARFERLDEFFIYIPNNEIGDGSPQGGSMIAMTSCAGYFRQAFVSAIPA
jgi:hypothetical protein